MKVLIKQIRDYIAHWNTNPKPFTWTATADEILAKVQHRPGQRQETRRQQREVTTAESRDTSGEPLEIQNAHPDVSTVPYETHCRRGDTAATQAVGVEEPASSSVVQHAEQCARVLPAHSALQTPHEA